MRTKLAKSINSNLRNFSSNIAEQYNKSVERICSDMQTEVDERVGEMNDQLQVLIKQKEDKQQNVDDLLATLTEQQKTIDRLQMKLNEVLR